MNMNTLEELEKSILNYSKLNIIEKIKFKIKLKRYFKYLKESEVK